MNLRATLLAFSAFAILSAARGLATQQKHFGTEVALDYVLIHGRRPVRRLAQGGRSLVGVEDDLPALER